MFKTDYLVEGLTADQYSNELIKNKILNSYQEKFTKNETPLTHPEKYNPLIPPAGWKYDPYYECWLES